MLRSSQLAASIAFTAALTAQAQTTINLDVPPSTPSAAIQVPADFIGFGIESAFFDHFINGFSDNLVSSVASRMSAPPIIRVGGTGGDKFIFDPSWPGIKECDVEASPDDSCEGEDGEPTHLAVFRIGRGYFESYKNGFSMAKYMVQAPLNNPANITLTKAFMSEILKNIGLDRIASVALGNEPGFYNGGETTLDEYVEAAISAQNVIMDELSLNDDEAKIFGIGETASEAKTGNNPSFGVVDILQTRINQSNFISGAAEHYYQYIGEHHVRDMQSWMDPTAIEQRLVANYSAAIAAAHDNDLIYTISEDAATLSSPEVSAGGSFAYALWALDFNLAAMSRGVNRVINLAGRPSAKRSFWTPENSSLRNPGFRVGAPFAAAVAVADFLNAGDSGMPAVARLAVDQAAENHLSAYGAYEQGSGALQKVALLNLNVWRPSSGERGVAVFNVPLPMGSSTPEPGPAPEPSHEWADSDLLTMIANTSGSNSRATERQFKRAAKPVKVRHLHAELGVDALGYDYCHARPHLAECGGDGAGTLTGLAMDHNVTWAGQQWTWAVDNGKGHGDLIEEELVVENVDGRDVVRVEVQDSEAVVLFL